jgi:hypothetical protein
VDWYTACNLSIVWSLQFVGRGKTPPADACTVIHPPSGPRAVVQTAVLIFLSSNCCAESARRTIAQRVLCERWVQDRCRSSASEAKMFMEELFTWKMSASSARMERLSSGSA